MLLIPVIFFVPNVFGNFVILPATRSVSGIGAEVDAFVPHISVAWCESSINFKYSCYYYWTYFSSSCELKEVTHQIIKSASITDGYRKIYREFELYSARGIRALMNNKLNLHHDYIIYFVAIVVYGYLTVVFLMYISFILVLSDRWKLSYQL